jgi:hypothetical protein
MANSLSGGNPFPITPLRPQPVNNATGCPDIETIVAPIDGGLHGRLLTTHFRAKGPTQ